MMNATMHTSFLFLLADDIGWADFSYNGGIARTPNIDKFARAPGSIKLMDMHSGGTVCSPTRASVLTGRTHFRDCVNFVYDCSDMTEGIPLFEFAPQRTFTVADALRQGLPSAESFFAGKWHLGSFYNDSETLGGMTSSPITHGFDHFNATVEVAPTMTTNYQCNTEWNKSVDYGHYGKPNHCNGGPNPGGGGLEAGCCFNYWWDDAASPHAVLNLSWPTPSDDAEYVVDSFDRFLSRRAGSPFLAHLSFHNCHEPFIGSAARRSACASGETCTSPAAGEPPYTSMELDFFACLQSLDDAVGATLGLLDKQGYAEDTLTWFTTDNGPEVNCLPDGICKGRPERPIVAHGTAGPLRGRKRDTWEGGHRVPGIVSFPRLVKANSESWTTVTTMDFLPTVLELLGNVSRPSSQSEWTVDGTSIVPILKGGLLPPRGLGWAFKSIDATSEWGYGFRYSKWKLVVGSMSCAQDDCKQPMLFDLESDLGERHDLSEAHPDITNAMLANFSAWQASVRASRTYESRCQTNPTGMSPCVRPPRRP
jgi:arylsulfatase A-like enzyme